VLTLDDVTRQAREKAAPANAQRVQPVIDLTLGIARIEANPIRVRVFAVREEIANGQIRGIRDVALALKRRVNQADQPARHHRMAAKHGP
jgi:hypothetical protein